MIQLRNLQLSCEILAANSMRSLLTVGCVVIGVAGFVLLIAIGAGAEQKLIARVRAMGTSVLIVNAAPAPRIAGRRLSSDTVTTLKVADATALLECCEHIASAAPAVNKSVLIHWEARSVATTTTGTTPAGLSIRNVVLESGRSFDELEDRAQRRVVILGAGVARTLFLGVDPLAQTVRIGRVPFEVIGVMQKRGIDVHGADQDDIVFVPLQTAMRRVLNISYVHALYIQASRTDSLIALEEEVRTVLRNRQKLEHGKPDSFVMLNQLRLIALQRQTMRAMDRLIRALAGAALFVAGAGIFAMMSLSVRERIVEVGLRRALGATRRDILMQFLLEGGVLAVAGGAIGLMCGVALTIAASALEVIEVAISWSLAMIGLGVCVAIAVVFGAYPAARAARVEPIESLRSER